MEKIKGFELVEKFLDGWKAENFKWYIEQNEAYLKAREDYNNNPSEAQQLYKAHYSEDLEAKKEAFLDKNFERHPEKKMWKVPKSRYWGSEKYSYEGVYNAIVHIINEEYAKFKDRWSHVLKIRDKVGNKYKTYEEVLEVILQREYERKYEKLVSDVQKITGDVQKADLHIGKTSNIEGFIEGCKGKAEIWSTLSGGEIQCLHIRFYCHKR